MKISKAEKITIKKIAINTSNIRNGPVPMAARSKAWVCGCSRAENVLSNPTGGMDVCLV